MSDSREHGQLSLPQCWQQSDLGITTLSSHCISREPGAEPSEQILSISYILLNLDAVENIPLNLGTYKVLWICPFTFPCQLWLHLSSGYTSQATAEPCGGPCAWSSPAREVMRLWTAALFFQQSLGSRAGHHLCSCGPKANQLQIIYKLQNAKLVIKKTAVRAIIEHNNQRASMLWLLR